MTNETYFANIAVYGFCDDNESTFPLTDECFWNRDEAKKFIAAIKNRAHYTIDGYTGKVLIEIEEKVETVSSEVF